MWKLIPAASSLIGSDRSSVHLSVSVSAVTTAIAGSLVCQAIPTTTPSTIQVRAKSEITSSGHPVYPVASTGVYHKATYSPDESKTAEPNPASSNVSAGASVTSPSQNCQRSMVTPAVSGSEESEVSITHFNPEDPAGRPSTTSDAPIVEDSP